MALIKLKRYTHEFGMHLQNLAYEFVTQRRTDVYLGPIVHL